MTEEDLTEKLAVYLATERSKMGVYPASQIAREVISMVRARDRQKRALDDLLRMDGELYDAPERPAPRLTEEDRARVEEISEIAEVGEGYADIPGGCPFCGQDPYHRTEFGEPVGIVCCEPMAWLHDNSEEDAEIREAVTALICKEGELKQAAREALSLIDKLTEAG